VWDPRARHPRSISRRDYGRVVRMATCCSRTSGNPLLDSPTPPPTTQRSQPGPARVRESVAARKIVHLKVMERDRRCHGRLFSGSQQGTTTFRVVFTARYRAVGVPSRYSRRRVYGETPHNQPNALQRPLFCLEKIKKIEGLLPITLICCREVDY